MRSICSLSAAVLHTAFAIGCIATVDDAADPEPAVALDGAEQAYPDDPTPTQRARIRTDEGDREVGYRRFGDLVVFDGDIVVPADEFDAARIDDASGSPRAAVTRLTARRWPNGIVPYEFAADFPDRARVTEAIDHWQRQTPFRFVARSGQTSYVRFVTGSGCSSQIGRQDGGQNITLAAGCHRGAAIHEIGHAIGFFHEQSRSDRDEHIVIHWECIQAGKEGNFTRYLDRGSAGEDLGPYDPSSIMHYERRAFSNGCDTITPRKAGVVLGRRELSLYDIDAAYRVYFGKQAYLGAGLYRDSDFAGPSAYLLPGDHRADYGDLAPVGDNAISSVTVPPGLLVEICDRVGAGCVTLGADARSMPSGFNDAVSHVVVRRAVTVFADRDYRGGRQTFGIGELRADRGQLGTVGDDKISSLVVAPGLYVEVCADSEGGPCRTFEGAVPYVGGDWNDRISRIRITAGVTLFENDNFGGLQETFPVGRFAAAAFRRVGNDKASSLVAGEGVRAVLWESDFSGRSREYRGDAAFVGDDLNDVASSVEIIAEP